MTASESPTGLEDYRVDYVWAEMGDMVVHDQMEHERGLEAGFGPGTRLEEVSARLTDRWFVISFHQAGVSRFQTAVF